MSWSFSVKLMPGETIIEEGETASSFGVQSEHTPILTDQRVMFKFNTLSSGLVQSFPYGEITGARSATRLMIRYLKLSVGDREHYLKVDDPDVWAAKIIEHRERFLKNAAGHESEPSPTKPELVSMLENLYRAGILTGEELAEKRKKVMG